MVKNISLAQVNTHTKKNWKSAQWNEKHFNTFFCVKKQEMQGTGMKQMHGLKMFKKVLEKQWKISTVKIVLLHLTTWGAEEWKAMQFQKT